MKYIGKFSSSTPEICEPLKKLTSSKYYWAWNNTCQNLYHGAKIFIKKNATVAFYNDKQQLCSKTNASGVSLGESLLQVRDGMQFQRHEAPDKTWKPATTT